MTTRRISSTLVVAATSLALLAPGLAGAQDEPGPYEPLGIRAGAFLIFPSATVSTVFDDNVRAEPSGERDSDVLFTLAPRIDVNSDWTRHALNFATGLEAGFHVDESDEDFLDAFASASGRLDVTRDVNVDGLLRWDRITELREAPEELGVPDKRTFYNRFQGRAGYTHRFARFRVGLRGTATRFDFRPVFGIGEDRDRWVFDTRLRGGFDVTPGINSFVQGSLNWRRFDDDVDRFGRKRNSQGFGVSTGAEFDITALLDGDVHVGFRRQSFNEPAFDSQSSLGFGGSLTWLPTALTTVDLSLSRDIIITTRDEDASGNIQSDVALGVRHEVLRNLTLNGDLRFTRDEFRGIERRDNTVRVGVGADYAITRNIVVGGGYQFTYRNSRDDRFDFRRNAVFLSVTGRL